MAFFVVDKLKTFYRITVKVTRPT